MMPHDARRGFLIGTTLLLAISHRAVADPMYSITPLSSRSTSAPGAAGINDLGQVAGSYNTSRSTGVGYLYDSTTGGVTTLPAPASATPPTVTNQSFTNITGLNNSGQVIGWQYAPDQTYSTGFLYSGGQYSPLPGLPMAINDRGQVAGQADFVNGEMTNLPPYAAPGGTAHSYIDTSGIVKDLGANFTPLALNDAGQAVGSVFTGAKITGAGAGGVHDVALYDGQSVKDLGTLGGQIGYGYAINSHGDIVGESQTATGFFHAFASQQAGKLVDLGTLPGGLDSTAEGINDKGQIVGNSFGPGSSGYHAFLYQNGSMTDLTSLLPTNSGITLTDAFRINNAGQILAVGHANGDDWESLYLLTPAGQSQPVAPAPLLDPTPAPEPSTLAFFALVSAAWAGRSFARRRSRGKGGAISS